ncbi:hypothetical protein [Nesterenkonia suensis]
MTIRAPWRTIAASAGVLLMLLPTAPAAGGFTPMTAETLDEPVLQGEMITGGGHPGDAVELSSGTQYLDEFTTGTLHYRIPREIDHSTLHIGVTALGQRGEGDPVRVETGTWEGDSCSSDTLSSTASGFRDHLRTTHVAAAPSWDGTGDGACGAAEEIVLTIALGGDPEDLRSVGEPVEILVHEEPRPMRLGELPPPDSAGDHEWRDIGRDVSGALEIEPGRSFGMAPALELGSTYDLEIRPGETQIFRVPVHWGERLQAEAFFPQPDDRLADRLAGMGSVSLAVTNPLRAMVDYDSGTLSTSSSTQYRVSPGPIRWFNREFDHNMLAGEQFLVVTADDHDTGESLPVLYRLTVGTFGEAGDGAPAYPEVYEEAWPTFSGGDVVPTGAGSGPLARISSWGDSPAVVAVLAVLGLLLIGSGSFVLVRALRNPHPLPDAPSPQAPNPHAPSRPPFEQHPHGQQGQGQQGQGQQGQGQQSQGPSPGRPFWGQGPDQR